MHTVVIRLPQERADQLRADLAPFFCSVDQERIEKMSNLELRHLTRRVLTILMPCEIAWINQHDRQAMVSFAGDDRTFVLTFQDGGAAQLFKETFPEILATNGGPAPSLFH